MDDPLKLEVEIGVMKSLGMPEAGRGKKDHLTKASEGS